MDISGYTGFLSKTSLLHGKEVITDILEKLYGSFPKKLILNKIEGDALFAYSYILQKPDLIKLSRILHDEFHKIITELTSKHDQCAFELCHRLCDLHIKFLIHSGRFAEHKIDSFDELIGVPVIELHRLQNNESDTDGYILATDKNGKYSSSYKHIGEINYNLIKFH